MSAPEQPSLGPSEDGDEESRGMFDVPTPWPWIEDLPGFLKELLSVPTVGELVRGARELAYEVLSAACYRSDFHAVETWHVQDILDHAEFRKPVEVHRANRGLSKDATPAEVAAYKDLAFTLGASGKFGRPGRALADAAADKYHVARMLRELAEHAGTPAATAQHDQTDMAWSLAESWSPGWWRNGGLAAQTRPWFSGGLVNDSSREAMPPTLAQVYYTAGLEGEVPRDTAVSTGNDVYAAALEHIMMLTDEDVCMGCFSRGIDTQCADSRGALLVLGSSWRILGLAMCPWCIERLNKETPDLTWITRKRAMVAAGLGGVR